MRHPYRSRRGEVKLLLLAVPSAVGSVLRRLLAEWREEMTLLVAARPWVIDPDTRKLRLFGEERSHRISFCARILIDVPVGDPP